MPCQLNQANTNQYALKHKHPMQFWQRQRNGITASQIRQLLSELFNLKHWLCSNCLPEGYYWLGDYWATTLQLAWGQKLVGGDPNTNYLALPLPSFLAKQTNKISASFIVWDFSLIYFVLIKCQNHLQHLHHKTTSIDVRSLRLCQKSTDWNFFGLFPIELIFETRKFAATSYQMHFGPK